MSRERTGQLLFLATTLSALVLYFVTTPVGVSWSDVAGATVVRGRPFLWGYFVEVFAGRYVALSSVSAAVAAGLLSVVVHRHFGWRAGACVAAAWIFSPPVWIGATNGVCGVFLAAEAIVVLWLANAGLVRLYVWLRASWLRRRGGMRRCLRVLPRIDAHARRMRVARLPVRGLVCVTLAFVLASALFRVFQGGHAMPVRPGDDVECPRDAEAELVHGETVPQHGSEDCVTDGNGSPDQWCVAMEQAFARSDHDGAFRLAKTILSAPDSASSVRAHLVLARLLSQNGNYTAGAVHFQAAVDATNALDTAAYNDYANALFKLGRLDDAEKWARRAVQVAPSSWDAKMTLAEVMAQKNGRMGGAQSQQEMQNLLSDLLKAVPEKK